MSLSNYIRKAVATLAMAGTLAFPLGVEQRSRRSQRMPRASYTRDIDSRLETHIDAYIKDLRKQGYLSGSDETSFVVYDIDHDRKVASINQDQRVMAASTIKVFVMLAYFDQIEAGKIREQHEDDSLLRKMVQKSSNSATNKLLKKIGGPRRVERILRAGYPYFDETDIVEYIPKDGRTYRNTTSAHDLNIFYNQLWRGRLPATQRMKMYLALPGRDRIFKGTCIPSGVRVYNKTGTVYGLVADSGIIVMKDPQGRAHPYAMTGIIEDRTKTDKGNRKESFGRWSKNRSEVIRSVSEGAYDFLYNMHTGKSFMCKQHKGKHLGSRQ